METRLLEGQGCALRRIKRVSKGSKKLNLGYPEDLCKKDSPGGYAASKLFQCKEVSIANLTQSPTQKPVTPSDSVKNHISTYHMYFTAAREG